LISRGKRYRKVLSILAKNGFGDIISRSLFSRFRNKASSQAQRKADRWIRFRKALEELGPTYVKFGQILSNRPGILPDDLIAELSRLQDQVASFPFEEVKQIIESEFGKPIHEVYPEFSEKPVASASIAQVHKAKLPDGQIVAVKIRRPGIEEIIRADVVIMKDIAKLMMRNEELSSLRPLELVSAFEKTILAELDFDKEFRNLRKFHELFQGDETVKIPAPIQAYCKDQLITLEYIEGIKISRTEELKAAGYDLRLIARRGFDAFFKQIFEWGHFHADPHPGNLIVMPGNIIGILDFGMVGQLSPADRSSLVEFVIALGRDDIARIVENIEKLQGSPIEDRSSLEKDLASFIADFGGQAVMEIDLNDALEKGRKLAFKHNLKLNPDLFLLFRTISLLEGIGISLDPEFRSLDVIKPYAFKLLRKQLDPRNLLKNKALISWAGDWYQLLQVLPGDIRKISAKLRDDQFKIKTENPATDRLSKQVKQTGNQLSKTLVFIALLVLGMYSTELKLPEVAWDLNWMGLTGFGLSFLILPGLIRSWFRK
jgi:ubiquinone biosynthesis protein